jgi:peptidoglycan/xylan/chitin deacetylase (PgdA/CDA1 family)
MRRIGGLAGRGMAIGILALTLPLGTVDQLRDLTPEITIMVNRRPVDVRAGTTFNQVVERLELEPSDGDLLDVQGEILRAGEYPGRTTLEGSVPTGDPRLFDGWVIHVVNGKDRTEGLVEQIVPIPADRPGNPQFFLGTQPGEQVITKGALSGKVVSSVFRPTGPADRPLKVALTFDDGPWPDSTRAILDTLKRLHAKATFFVIGELAQARPELIRAELKAGMEVQSHSWSHPSTPFRELPAKQVRLEIKRCRKVLSDLGAESTLFRPPGGSFSPQVVKIAEKLGARLVLWDVDPQDWADDAKAKQIAKAVLKNVRPGSIILLHDGGGDQSATVKALPRIVRGIRDMGLGLTTLSLD